jgi:hypothetical protein
MKMMYPAVLVAALLIMPAIAAADPNPPGTPSPEMRQGFQYMEQARAKVEALHAQARLAALNALTPAHRALLGQVVAQLVIAANPDVNVAAQTIDRALSQTEGRSILNISQSLNTQTQQIMEAARQQMMAAMPQGAEGPGGPGEHHHNMFFFEQSANSNDPGTILLMMSLHALQPAGPPQFHP